MTTRVFVFGTLKEGFPNFSTNAGTRVPGTFVTAQRYPFYLVGERHSPWLVNTPGHGEHVLGQVFDVGTDALEHMDLLERTRESDGYDRIEIEVRQQSTQDTVQLSAYAYVKHPRNLQGAEIKAGPFSEYTHEHAVLYRKRAP